MASKDDTKGAAAVRAVLSGASIADVSRMLEISERALRRRLRQAFVDMIKKKKKHS
jgi:transposase-like protein